MNAAALAADDIMTPLGSGAVAVTNLKGNLNAGPRHDAELREAKMQTSERVWPLAIDFKEVSTSRWGCR